MQQRMMSMLKALRLSGNILFYTAHRDRTIRKSYSTLQSSLISAYVKFKDSPTPPNRESHLSQKSAFDALLTQIESKYTFISRSKFHRHGNRSGRLLSNLLKGQHPPTIIKRLRRSDGLPTAVGGEISSILHSFYTELYSWAHIGENAKKGFWKDVVLPQMSPEQATSLVCPITAEEVKLAIKQLKNNKATGPDGLSNEFYKIQGPRLIDTLVSVFNNLLEGNDLPLYFNSALLKILQKPGRDPELPASYRPISFPNSDYKLYAKILAEKLKLILPHIIHEAQTGFIPGRHSVTNVRKVLTVMQWLELQNSNGPHAILSLDAKKAFDLVAWAHLFETLSRFGSPETFISLLQRLYSGSLVMLHLTPVFHTARHPSRLSPLPPPLCYGDRTISGCLVSYNNLPRY